jgi:hypothetical protein
MNDKGDVFFMYFGKISVNVVHTLLALDSGTANCGYRQRFWVATASRDIHHVARLFTWPMVRWL